MHRYANDHRHSGLGHYTPRRGVPRHRQHDHAHRQQRLDQAYAQHPERFRKPPKASALPGPTGISFTKTQAALSQTA